MPKLIPQYRDASPWYQALASKYGIVLRTNNIRNAFAMLYAARKNAADESLAGLSLRPSPERADELLIIKTPSGEAKGGKNGAK